MATRPGTERLFVTPASRDRRGIERLAIEFAGVLNDKLRGFYRSTYIDDDGDQQVIATTQMQATDCRRAFPCWDEPEFKAVFGVTLDVDEGLTAISNSPEVERSTEHGARIRFADTMVMSSYLVAFVVGAARDDRTGRRRGCAVASSTCPARATSPCSVSTSARFSLRWFQDYYGIAYPGDKVDLVALPDFAAGAMEKPSAASRSRESLLLVDPATSTQNEQTARGRRRGPRLAHMWFGDLVTMRWWNGIWLNEAFATFMEIARCEAFRADWERWTTVGLERSVAFETDSLASTRSGRVRGPLAGRLRRHVRRAHLPERAGHCSACSSSISAPNGSASGVDHYLRTPRLPQHRDQRPVGRDRGSTTGEPVRRLMDSWIWQPGYPQVSAALVAGAAGASVRLTGSCSPSTADAATRPAVGHPRPRPQRRRPTTC